MLNSGQVALCLLLITRARRAAARLKGLQVEALYEQGQNWLAGGALATTAAPVLEPEAAVSSRHREHSSVHMASTHATELPRPDGISADHIEPRGGLHRHASPLSLTVLGAVVAIGLSGLVGGRRAEHTVRNAAGAFGVLAPAVIRNGEIFESRFKVVAERRIEHLVIAAEPGLWRDVTTNSTVPAPAKESFEGGMLRWAFDAVEAGATFEFQLAQQINPSLEGTNRGKVVFLDGKQPLAEFALTLTVLP